MVVLKETLAHVTRLKRFKIVARYEADAVRRRCMMGIDFSKILQFILVHCRDLVRMLDTLGRKKIGKEEGGFNKGTRCLIFS